MYAVKTFSIHSSVHTFYAFVCNKNLISETGSVRNRQKYKSYQL